MTRRTKSNSRAIIIAAVAALILVARGAAHLPPASAQIPPGQDRAFHVTLSTTAPAAHPTLTMELTICTDGTGIGGLAHECLPGTPATPFFDAANMSLKGIMVSGAQPLAARTHSIAIDIETNGGAIQGAGGDKGQPAPCGAIIHATLPPIPVWASAKTGAVISMDPSATPGFSFDQLDDPAQANGGDATQGNGWPAGISQVPAVIGVVQTLAGISSGMVIARGYGVVALDPGMSQTTVSILTVATGSAPGTADPITNIALLGNPFGAASPTAANITTCPPYSSSLTSYGVALNSDGSKSINGTLLTGANDFSPPAIGLDNNTICSVGCTAGYSYDIMLSSTGDDDGDGINNTEDNCPTISNAVQSPSLAGIGTACSAGQGYDNNNAGALATLAACVVPTTCTDIDADGFFNAVDNCPFVANPAQKDYDGDGRGDACEGNGTDPAVAPKNNPIAGVKGDGSGYANGRLPGVATVGQLDDHSDICKVAFTAGGTLTPPTICLSFGTTPLLDGTTGLGYVWQDSNNDGVPDFLCAGACTSGNVNRDHKSDANGDGYSDADEGTPANCSVASCASILTSGGSLNGATAETASCRNAGRNCGAGVSGTWDPLTRAKNSVGGAGTGCLKTLDEAGSLKTINLARSDVDLDGSDSILDLSKMAGWFGNDVGDQTDPRWEGNLDGDGAISILDLSLAAANFGRSVNGGCAIL